MLRLTHDPIVTPRLELRRTRVEDAPAMFDALRNTLIYTLLPRAPPSSVAEVETRFARVMQETAADRADQWLNWTVWLRETERGVGTIEATVRPDHQVEIGYLFDPRVWGHGFARESVAAMIGQLRNAGAASFVATIDVRNPSSKALAAALGFTHAATRGIDETWRFS